MKSTLAQRPQTGELNRCYDSGYIELLRQKTLFAERVHFLKNWFASPIWWPASEEWGKMKKTGSKNVGKENGSCFSCSYDRVGRAGKLFVFLYSVNGIW